MPPDQGGTIVEYIPQLIDSFFFFFFSRCLSCYFNLIIHCIWLLYIIQCSGFRGCFTNIFFLLSTSFRFLLHWRRPFNQVFSRANFLLCIYCVIPLLKVHSRRSRLLRHSRVLTPLVSLLSLPVFPGSSQVLHEKRLASYGIAIGLRKKEERREGDSNRRPLK